MLAGKNALITGSTSGIGLGIARALARRGVNLMLHGMGDPEQIARLQAELAAGKGVRVVHDATDFSQPERAVDLVRATAEKLGSIDILVNNAGIQFVSPVEQFPPERWAAILNIALNASFHTIRGVVPGMRERNWGRIINIASAHGLVASPYKSAYVSAKHGLVGLTRSVALELAETGVTCNAICPGYVRTALVESQIEDQAKVHQLPRERVIREVILAAQPSKRFVEIDEIAALVVFLCGDEACSITGAALPIDGGWTAR